MGQVRYKKKLVEAWYHVSIATQLTTSGAEPAHGWENQHSFSRIHQHYYHVFEFHRRCRSFAIVQMITISWCLAKFSKMLLLLHNFVMYTPTKAWPNCIHVHSHTCRSAGWRSLPAQRFKILEICHKHFSQKAVSNHISMTLSNGCGWWQHKCIENGFDCIPGPSVYAGDRSVLCAKA